MLLQQVLPMLLPSWAVYSKWSCCWWQEHRHSKCSIMEIILPEGHIIPMDNGKRLIGGTISIVRLIVPPIGGTKTLNNPNCTACRYGQWQYCFSLSLYKNGYYQGGVLMTSSFSLSPLCKYYQSFHVRISLLHPSLQANSKLYCLHATLFHLRGGLYCLRAASTSGLQHPSGGIMWPSGSIISIILLEGV